MVIRALSAPTDPGCCSRALSAPTDPGCSQALLAHRSRLLPGALSPQIQAALQRSQPTDPSCSACERSRPTKTERGVARARGWAETEPPSKPTRVSVVQLWAERASEGDGNIDKRGPIDGGRTYPVSRCVRGCRRRLRSGGRPRCTQPESVNQCYGLPVRGRRLAKHQTS